jgi:TRAP-type mannitol/chloroaromatic compound transport system permease small subunit
VWVAGALLMSAVFMIGAEIGLRRLFGLSLRGAHELSGYTLALCTSWAFAWALFQKAHIRIDLLYARVPSGLQIVLNLLALVLFCFFMALAVYYAWDVLSTSWVRDSRANTPLGTPLWIPQSIWFLGLAWFGLCLVLLTMRTIVAALQRDSATAQQLAGARSLGEDISEAQATLAEHGAKPARQRPPD